ncbi:spore coat protein SP96-like [Lineus longissimus]|uniref:spore coat protein SP96-like n=1 Tax=Lineus longissimus TaxID=88925 RepID=UPI00315D967E
MSAVATTADIIKPTPCKKPLTMFRGDRTEQPIATGIAGAFGSGEYQPTYFNDRDPSPTPSRASPQDDMPIRSPQSPSPPLFLLAQCRTPPTQLTQRSSSSPDLLATASVANPSRSQTPESPPRCRPSSVTPFLTRQLAARTTTSASSARGTTSATSTSRGTTTSASSATKATTSASSATKATTSASKRCERDNPYSGNDSKNTSKMTASEY